MQECPPVIDMLQLSLSMAPWVPLVRIEFHIEVIHCGVSMSVWCPLDIKSLPPMKSHSQVLADNQVLYMILSG